MSESASLYPAKPVRKKKRHLVRRIILWLVFLLVLAAISAHAKQRTGADDIVSTVGLEEFECGAGFRTFLQFVQNQAGLPRDKGGTWDDGRDVHYNVVHLLGALECYLGLWLFEEIDIDDVDIILHSKLPDRKSLAALTNSFYD